MIKDLQTRTPLEQLENLDSTEYILQCAACNLRSQCSNPLAPHNNLEISPPELMIIEERPSFEEETCGKSYLDRHNKYLLKILAPKFSPLVTYLTYLTKCFSGTNIKLGKNNTKICKNMWLDKEIALFKPKKILCLGKTVCNVMGGTGVQFGQIKNNIGFWQSATVIFNAGAKHTEQFKKFLEKLKDE